MKQVCGVWFPESDKHFKLGIIDEQGNYQRDTFDALKLLQQMGMEIVQQVRKDYILTWKNQ